MCDSGCGRRVLIAGLPQGHTELLAAFLSTWHVVDTTSEAIAAADGPEDGDTVIIAGMEGLPSDPLLAAVFVRAELFLWHPLILLGADLERQSLPDWAVEVFPLPPDIGALNDAVKNLGAFPVARRVELVGQGLQTLSEELSFLRRAVLTGAALDDEQLRALLQRTIELCQTDPIADDLTPVSDLASYLRGLTTQPSISWRALEPIGQLAATAEHVCREAGCSDALKSLLHRLNNVAKLEHATRIGSDVRLSRVHRLLSHLPGDLAAEHFPEQANHLEAVRKGLLAQLSDASLAEDRERLRDVIEALTPPLEALRRQALDAEMRGTLGQASDIERIVIVEDETGWREQLLAVLESMRLAQSIELAATVEQAREIFRASDCGTLALVDLGLPRNEAEAVDGTIALDGGISLISEFSGPKSRIRFVVLTAAENYSDGVRAVLAQGVTPTDYIQKGPDWEAQLRSRVTIALRQETAVRHVVDVFRCTGRLVRVDGVDIELDGKPYVVLEYLSERADRWCEVSEMRSALSTGGPHDITPPMGKEIEEAAARGDIPWPSPFELLSPARLQDYIYTLRDSVWSASRAVGRTIEPDSLIQFRADPPAYRLNARARIHHSFCDLTGAPPADTVLVVEDDPGWLADISAELEGLGFSVLCAQTAEQAKHLALEARPELISLDLELPADEDALRDGKTADANGRELAEFLAIHLPDARIAVLTSVEWKDALMLEMLSRGVAIRDYISKGWSDPLERLGRSLWRLQLEAQRGALIADGGEGAALHHVVVGSDASVIEIDGREVRLSAKPAQIIRALANSPNVPVERDALKDALWPDPDDMPDEHDRALNSVIARLRREIATQTEEGNAGKDIIRAKDGVYWLQGVVHRSNC